MHAQSREPPSFQWAHLWQPAIVNPVNLKSYTIPLFNLWDPYARAFHLSWLGFFVAFLSWFAFPPLIPDAIKSDLHLSAAEVANSNVIALTSTFVIRVIVGPLVDRYGPRKVMAYLLILGAIPSGLAGTAHDAGTLYILRFFIGILGATFVPCQAWTSAFFDKNCVGTANALVGGWAGKWSERHNTPATQLALRQGYQTQYTLHHDESATEKNILGGDSEKAIVSITDPATDSDASDGVVVQSTVDIAVNETLTAAVALKLLVSPLTWLPALGYLTTFGIELAIDSSMSGVLFTLFSKRRPGFTQTTAGYYTSIFGLLNIVTRPLGGYLGDVIYRYYGTRGKKVWTVICGLIMGASLLAGGFYLQNHRTANDAQLSVLMGIFSVAAIFSEIGNGANFSLVPHCNPFNNGFMSGLVGSFGNLGGIVFALVFRFVPQVGKAFWIMGVLSIAINVLILPIPVPKL
ncbi:Nitrate transporter [Psilocybe cubensis]|uniref:Nitrate transporter n=1 Tax=Psilocybe cubensis TaxID=181762 RepID=A0ACB8GTZ5_PSICU|nr:Nitrate transporter [Psilocybe cubensis]KAH9478950.1 Nitrate transporter [Psilocybe cubensis]